MSVQLDTKDISFSSDTNFTCCGGLYTRTATYNDPKKGFETSLAVEQKSIPRHIVTQQKITDCLAISSIFTYVVVGPLAGTVGCVVGGFGGAATGLGSSILSALACCLSAERTQERVDTKLEEFKNGQDQQLDAIEGHDLGEFSIDENNQLCLSEKVSQKYGIAPTLSKEVR